MFRNINQCWKVDTVYVDWNIKRFGDNKQRPIKKLINHDLGMALTIAPYRVVYEPCFVDDNNVIIEIMSGSNLPESLIKKLEAFCHEMIIAHGTARTNHSFRCLFILDFHDSYALSLYFEIIEDFLIDKYTLSKSLYNGRKLLRGFMQLPDRIYSVPVDNVSELIMPKDNIIVLSQDPPSIRIKI